MRIVNGTVFIDRLRSMSPGMAGMSVTDTDGTTLNLSMDAVAHIVSMAFHHTQRVLGREPTLLEVLDLHCSCPDPPAGEKKR